MNAIENEVTMIELTRDEIITAAEFIQAMTDDMEDDPLATYLQAVADKMIAQAH